jgi:hypothetical protein
MRSFLPHYPKEIPMLRIGAFVLSFAALLLCTAPAYAQPASTSASAVPAYFFSQWKVQSNCIEQGFDAAEQTQLGLQWAITPGPVSADGLSYGFTPIDSATQAWPAGWSLLTLEYRPGIAMPNIPADFACVPGQPSSSALLAMSNFTQSAEPYYEYEHWYGVVTLHGEPHHCLIFPRNVTGSDSAIIVLLDAGAAANVQLDQDGTIHSEND